MRLGIYYENINALLSDGSNDSIKKLLDMFVATEVKQYVGKDTRLSYVYLWLKIYEVESKCGIEEHIFKERKSIGELYEMWNDLKFLIWHIEFDSESNAIEQLEQYTEYSHLSYYALTTAIDTISINRENMMKKLGINYE